METMTLATNQDIVKAFGLEGLRVTEFTLHAALEELPLVTITRRVTVGELETVRFQLHKPEPVVAEDWLEKRAREAHATVTKWFDWIAEDVILAFPEYQTELCLELDVMEPRAADLENAIRRHLDRIRPARYMPAPYDVKDWGR
jgi:hypothetical protein